MTRGLILALGAFLVGSSVIAPIATAQPTPSGFKVAVREGTASEAALIDGIIARVQQKSTDEAFWKRVDNAIAQNNLSTAKSLLAGVAQTRSDQAFIMPLQKRASVIGRPNADVFRLASFDRSASAEPEPFNPFCVVVIVSPTRAYCWGTLAACQAAAEKLGGYIA